MSTWAMHRIASRYASGRLVDRPDQDLVDVHVGRLVEGWFALPTWRQLQRGAFRSTHALELAIRRYIEVSNTNPKSFVWTKTAEEVLDSVKRFCQRNSNSVH